MPEETPEVETTPEVEVEQTTDPKPEPKPTETVEFWKAKAREQEKRAKDNAAKAAEFDKLTESAKTDLQKAIERAEAAEKDAAGLRAAQEISEWKAKAAKDAGVPADVLRGNTEEEIQAHAQSLKALLPEPRKPGQVLGEGRTITTDKGSAAQDFAAALQQAGLPGLP